MVLYCNCKLRNNDLVVAWWWCRKLGVSGSICKLIPTSALSDIKSAAKSFALDPLKDAFEKVIEVIDDIINAMPDAAVASEFHVKLVSPCAG